MPDPDRDPDPGPVPDAERRIPGWDAECVGIGIGDGVKFGVGTTSWLAPGRSKGARD